MHKIYSNKFALFLVTAILTMFLFVKSSYSATIGASNISTSETSRNFSINQYGFGGFVEYEFDLLKGVTTLANEFTSLYDADEEDEIEEKVKNKAKDKVFSAIDIFYNYYGDGIDQNYGISYSLGYKYKKIGLFASGGYVKTDFDYIEGSKVTASSKGSGFVGIGASYNITDNIKTKLTFMSYNFAFAPENSVYDKIKVDVRATNLAIGYSF